MWGIFTFVAFPPVGKRGASIYPDGVKGAPLGQGGGRKAALFVLERRKWRRIERLGGIRDRLILILAHFNSEASYLTSPRSGLYRAPEGFWILAIAGDEDLFMLGALIFFSVGKHFFK